LIWEKYYHTAAPIGKLEGSFWWKAHVTLLNDFKMMSSCTIGFGQTVLLWKDKWEGEILNQKFPELHPYAIDETLSVQSFCETQDWTEHFHLPMSIEAYE
jgi:hypothetical protein